MKLDTKTITAIVLAVGTVGWVVWDLIVNFNKVEGDTISEVLGGAAKSAPILAVTLGVICGHLFSYFPGTQGLLTFLGDRPILGFTYGVIGGWLFWNLGR
jgi:hypothetical protein